jgi:anthraniloyl-CoA monooxygenase
MGDSAHTAHFAIGSGTKLAIDDAIELARQFRDIGDTPDDIPPVLAAYESVRRVDVARIQNAARNGSKSQASAIATISNPSNSCIRC